MNTKKKRIIVVLGMHRSGTSAVARSLQVLGVELGDNLMPPMKDVNEKGFWEDLDLFTLNDELLKFLGNDWHHLKPIKADDMENLRSGNYFDKAMQLLEQKIENIDIFGFKDPRLAKLLSFWREVFDNCQLEASCIVAVRHPLSVAKSLAKRDGFDAEKSYFLWLGHVIASLWGSMGLKRVLVDYDRLMRSPKHEISRIADRLDLKMDLPELQRYETDFLDSSLRHSVYEPGDLSADRTCPPLAKEVYAALLDVASDKMDLDEPELRLLAERWMDEYKRLNPILSLVDRFSERDAISSQTIVERDAQIVSLSQAVRDHDRQIIDLKQLVINLEQEVTEKKREVAALYNSMSWRITSPLRAVSREFKLNHFLDIANGAARKRLPSRYILNPRVQRLYTGLRKTSSRIIYPFIPRLHEAIFVDMAQYVKRRYLTEDHAFQSCSHENLYVIKNPASEFVPKVSVIVPSYNHASFLRPRLDSIYTQTYSNIEIILLDDASTDGSQDILSEYQQRYPRITRSIFNKENSGGRVFNQWQRGLEMARGDLIWIAESDDYCSDNFLAELVKYFINEAIMLAYCRSIFVEGRSAEPVWNLEDYLTDIGLNWHEPFIASAHYLVNNAWAIKNIIPNVSSAIFRHPGNLQLLTDETWKQMKICGDWVFYLHIVRGGLVAYTPEATNCYRLHQTNASRSTYSTDVYYQEHELVVKALLTLYRVNEELLIRQRHSLQLQWRSFRADASDDSFINCYDYRRVQHCAEKRKPNLLMVSFALTTGGGETFPIELANLLKAAGYGITFLNCHKVPTEAGVRQMLRNDIPLLELDTFEKLNSLIADMGIEIIHSHHGSIDVELCRFLDHNSNTQLVVTTHGMYETIPPTELTYALPLLKKRVRKFVYLTEKNLAPFRRYNFDVNNFVQIDNALNITQIKPVPRSLLGVPPDAFLICLVSRAIPEKGWEEGIQAVTLARNISQRDIHLLLVGAGPEYERLKPIVQNDFIHFVGFQPNTRDYFAASNLGFLPSRFKGESFPLVLIECLHANRPMLASNIGEIKNMLLSDGGSAGTVFDLENGAVPITTVAEIIAAYAIDSNLYFNHLEYVRTAAAKFDPAIMLKNYERVYRELLTEVE